MPVEPKLTGHARQVYDAVVDQIAEEVGVIIRDALAELELKLSQSVRHEVDGRLKSLVTVIKALPQPVVNITTPKRRLEKSIIYGPSGRPERVVEEESAE